MTDTIESFVERLQAEGVEAGRKQAEALRQEAQAQAQAILQQARNQAQKVLAEAKAQAEGILAKGRTELKLAARDSLLRLRDAIKRCLEAVLAEALKRQLSDTDFLKDLLHELVVHYAQGNLEGRPTMEIRVSPQIRQKLLDWALGEIGRIHSEGKPAPVDLKGTLSQAGFECAVSGGTLEVTVESVTAVLKELISPELRRILDEAAAQTSG